MMKRKALTIGFLVIAALLYQAPNLALVAHLAGLSLAKPDNVGVDVTMKGGWYPIAANNSLLGRISIPNNAPPMVAFHRPTLVWPWKADVFAIMALKSVDPKSIESTQTFPWGTATLLKPTGNDPRRLYAVSGLAVGILVSDPGPLQDIVTFKKTI
jgi:hypothetical protein